MALLLLPIDRRIDSLLLSAASVLRLRWAELSLRERLAGVLAAEGDLRSALGVGREGVERAVGRGGFDLALASAGHGMLLLRAGWIAQGTEYLRVAEAMTRGWPAGRLRDLVLIALANGLVSRGELAGAEKLLALVDTPGTRGRGAWSASLDSVLAAGRLAAADWPGAAALYRGALDAADLAASRDLVVVIDNNLAGALVKAGDFAGAEARLAAAEALVAKRSPLAAHLAGTRAELELARGDLAASRQSLERSSALKAAIGAEGGLGWTLATRARLEAAAGEIAESRRLLAQAAGRLEDVEALRAWRAAAAAIGDSDLQAGLAPFAADDLLERARAASAPVPARAWEIHRGVGYGLALGMGFALFRLGVRHHDLIPGGFNTLTVLYLGGVIALLAWIALRRLPRG